MQYCPPPPPLPGLHWSSRLLETLVVTYIKIAINTIRGNAICAIRPLLNIINIQKRCTA